MLKVSGGTVKRAQRLNRPSNVSWEIKVKPRRVRLCPSCLSPTTDCQADGAVCTKVGKALSSSLSAAMTGAASKPVAFELVANCPNSFDAETQFAYILPRPG